MYKAFFLSALAICLSSPSPSANVNNAQLSINTSSPGLTIPANFVGMSFELSAVSQTKRLSQNTGLTTIMSALGKNCALTFGGNTSDTSTPMLSRIADGATFGQSVCNGKQYWGMSIVPISPNTTIAQQAITDSNEAAQLITTLGASNLSLMIGNEPNDIYGAASYSSFLADWTTIYNVIIGANPAANVSGPTVETAWILPDVWVGLFAQLSTINELTIHCGGLNVSLTGNVIVDTLNALQNSYCFQDQYETIIPIVKTRGLGDRVTESNSFIGSGSLTEGNSLAATEVMLTMMNALAKAGFEGMNFHEGNGISAGSYLPIGTNDGVNYFAQSPYYAMLMFQELIGGQVVGISGGLPDRFVIAVKIGTIVYALVVNPSPTAILQAQITTDFTISAAAEEMLSGGSAGATAVNLGGQTIPPSGVFSHNYSGLPINGGNTVTLNLCAACSAMFRLSP